MSSEKRECRWSKGKGNWPDTEGSGFESQLAVAPQTFPALILFASRENYLLNS